MDWENTTEPTLTYSLVNNTNITDIHKDVETDFTMKIHSVDGSVMKVSIDGTWLRIRTPRSSDWIDKQHIFDTFSEDEHISVVVRKIFYGKDKEKQRLFLVDILDTPMAVISVSRELNKKLYDLQATYGVHSLEEVLNRLLEPTAK